MPFENHFERLKSELEDISLVRKQGFRILAEISDLINRREFHDLGRELVIRALSVKDHFGESARMALLSLVRSVGLFPYLIDDRKYLNVIDEIALEFHRAPDLENPVFFHSLQAKVYNSLMSGMNVVLSASTSVGKSLIIDAIVASGKFRNIVIILPTIALIDETRRRLSRQFGQKFKIITHGGQNTSSEEGNIYILTQERVLARNDIDSIDLLVIDEFYKLDLRSEKKDQSRTIELNIAFEKLSRVSRQFYLIGPNIQSVEGITSNEFVFFPSSFTTVAVDIKKFNLPTNGDERIKTLSKLCKGMTDQTLIYCQSPSRADFIANYLINYTNIDAGDNIDSAVEWIESNYHREWVLAQALKRGIGLHHGAMPRSLQQYFIHAFNNKKIKFLICTSTIIEGVNTSAKNVIIYDRRKNTNLLDHFTYMNVQGRAGRMGRFFIGKVFCLEEPPKPESFTVVVPIGSQSENTPVGLLSNIPDELLTDYSRERLRQVAGNGTLSMKVIAENMGIEVESQIAIARIIHENVASYESLFSWRGYPKPEQLYAACDIIFNYLEGRGLTDICITSTKSLVWHLQELSRTKSPSLYVKSVLSSDEFGRSVTKTIGHSLRFLRNLASYRIPSHIRAIDRIRRDVLARHGISSSGDMGPYAAMLDNIFVNPAIYSLDEYGIPIELGLKLEPFLLPGDDLEKALSNLRSLDFTAINLSAFERELVELAQEGL